MIKQLTSGAYILNVAMAVVVAWLWKSLPPKIPWMYSLPWGEEQLISKIWWAASLGIWTMIFFLTKKLIRWAAKDDDQVEMVLTWSLVIINGLFLAGIYKVLRLVAMI